MYNSTHYEKAPKNMVFFANCCLKYFKRPIRSMTSFLVVMLFVVFGYSGNAQEPDCSHTPEARATDDGSCTNPTNFGLSKFDRSFEGVEYIYLKASGNACCGEVFINPKAGRNCFELYIAGPAGPGVAITEIGTVPSDCDVAD